SATAAHFRLGHVDLKLGTILLLGGLAGAAIGVRVIKALRALGNADLVIIITYVVVLGSVGTFMFLESLQTLRRGAMPPRQSHPVRRVPFLSKLPLQMNFPRSNVSHAVFVPFLLCALVGILAAVMGVGGGFIMVPMMVYLLRMPMHVAVGTDLFQIVFTCAGITLMQAATNFTVDIVLAILVAVGSTVGAQIGARLSRVLRGEQLRIVLASVVLATTVKMAIALLLEPANFLTRAAS
ncbi:MAG TPA: sulfite exporter TauE/SafE family protein, partial [Edaphobacter sp.]|uniref:sulfite exporter TauE/SafE family protein n=1 Tax=Edaphobacter sp. TaxID=1934404 RepID=UPI002C3A1BAD